MNQPDFAALAGTTKKTQITYEKGVMPDAAYLAAIAQAGADVRYIVTGEREGPAPEVLTADERELLALFRGATLAVKAAAIGALQGASSLGKATQNIHGPVAGNVISGSLVKVRQKR
jgi:transcriptional regulator with XRE-family HTH domain